MPAGSSSGGSSSVSGAAAQPVGGLAPSQDGPSSAASAVAAGGEAEQAEGGSPHQLMPSAGPAGWSRAPRPEAASNSAEGAPAAAGAQPAASPGGGDKHVRFAPDVAFNDSGSSSSAGAGGPGAQAAAGTASPRASPPRPTNPDAFYFYPQDPSSNRSASPTHIFMPANKIPAALVQQVQRVGSPVMANLPARALSPGRMAAGAPAAGELQQQAWPSRAAEAWRMQPPDTPAPSSPAPASGSSTAAVPPAAAPPSSPPAPMPAASAAAAAPSSPVPAASPAPPLPPSPPGVPASGPSQDNRPPPRPASPQAAMSAALSPHKADDARDRDRTGHLYVRNRLTRLVEEVR